MIDDQVNKQISTEIWDQAYFQVRGDLYYVVWRHMSNQIELQGLTHVYVQTRTPALEHAHD